MISKSQPLKVQNQIASSKSKPQNQIKNDRREVAYRIQYTGHRLQIYLFGSRILYSISPHYPYSLD